MLQALLQGCHRGEAWWRPWQGPWCGWQQVLTLVSPLAGVWIPLLLLPLLTGLLLLGWSMLQMQPGVQRHLRQQLLDWWGPEVQQVLQHCQKAERHLRCFQRLQCC